MKNMEGGNVVLQREGDEPDGPLTVLYPSAGKPYRGLIGNMPKSPVPELIRAERGFTGSSDGWVKSYFDISSYAGKRIRFGFDFAAPGFRTSKGWLIGWARIWCDSVIKPKEVRKGRKVTADEATKIYKLQPSEPEPFSTQATSGYVIPLETHVRADVLNPLGGLVRTLVDSTVQAGFYKIDWDGKDDREREVSEGVYYFHFKVEDFEAIQRCTYLKGESQPEESE
jgi:hypothetical protein